MTAPPRVLCADDHQDVLDALPTMRAQIELGRVLRSARRLEGEGPGIGETKNWFVPFFTTKPGGSGIGLVLARQIAEAHGGTVTPANRAAAGGAGEGGEKSKGGGAGGCEARLTLRVAS